MQTENIEIRGERRRGSACGLGTRHVGERRASEAGQAALGCHLKWSWQDSW